MRKKRKKEQIVLEEGTKKLKVKLALFFLRSKFTYLAYLPTNRSVFCITALHFPNTFSTANKDKLIEKLYQRKCMM